MHSRVSRRDILKASLGASTALAAGCVFAQPLRAAPPEPSAITPVLVEAARKEGKVSFYTALELPVAERFGKLFEAKYPGIAVRVERSGAERIFQRIAQEQGSRINAVDVANSTDPAHYLEWTQNRWLAPYVPEDVARHFPADHRDPDGMYATVCAWLSVIGYNTNLVKPEDAPKSFADLLEPKWKGRIVKAHPSYSGAILTVTFLLARELGWDFFEKLAEQKVLQVQSAAEPPKKIQAGERAVMSEGNDYNLTLLKEQGQPVEAVHPVEGTPVIIVPCGIFRNAPNPNAARLFESFLFGAEAQQMFVDAFAHRSFHGLVKEKPGRTPLSAFKLLRADPAEVLAQSESLKARYSKTFGV
jgi:iron(III) transport system substrate-binding protein